MVFARTETGNTDSPGPPRGRIPVPAGGAAGRANPSSVRKITTYPLRSLPSQYPSSHRRAYACSTVTVLTAAASASTRREGSFEPYGYTPATMSSRSRR